MAGLGAQPPAAPLLGQIEVVDARLAVGRGEEFSAARIRERQAADFGMDDEFFLPINHRANDPLETSELNITTVDTAVPESNKGFQMLRAMGWQEGRGLGRNEDGVREPVRGGVEAGLRLGVGKAEEDSFYTAAENIVRKRLEAEVQADEDEGRMRRREEPSASVRSAIRADVAVAQRNLFCETCHKQYKTAAELETHLSSYDHHHKKRLMELKADTAERTRHKRGRREKRRAEKEAAKLQEQQLPERGGAWDAQAAVWAPPLWRLMVARAPTPDEHDDAQRKRWARLRAEARACLGSPAVAALLAPPTSPTEPQTLKGLGAKFEYQARPKEAEEGMRAWATFVRLLGPAFLRPASLGTALLKVAEGVFLSTCWGDGPLLAAFQAWGVLCEVFAGAGQLRSDKRRSLLLNPVLHALQPTRPGSFDGTQSTTCKHDTGLSTDARCGPPAAVQPRAGSGGGSSQSGRRMLRPDLLEQALEHLLAVLAPRQGHFSPLKLEPASCKGDDAPASHGAPVVRLAHSWAYLALRAPPGSAPSAAVCFAAVMAPLDPAHGCLAPLTLSLGVADALRLLLTPRSLPLPGRLHFLLESHMVPPGCAAAALRLWAHAAAALAGGLAEGSELEGDVDAAGGAAVAAVRALAWPFEALLEDAAKRRKLLALACDDEGELRRRAFAASLRRGVMPAEELGPASAAVAASAVAAAAAYSSMGKLLGFMGTLLAAAHAHRGRSAATNTELARAAEKLALLCERGWPRDDAEGRAPGAETGADEQRLQRALRRTWLAVLAAAVERPADLEQALMDLPPEDLDAYVLRPMADGDLPCPGRFRV
ncbi:hypothetical protein WJX81_002576 [Elliptochloris bilobata]|uniref:G-patch domain-containing protein n=1 Tax=Elliptochloris bilobata TaxID=381761 RepID=A0AAW1QZ39_9CHLO